MCLGNNTCRPHHGGALCGECEPGYEMIRGDCRLCDGPNGVSIFAALLLLFVFVFYSILMLRPSTGLLSVLIFYSQTMAFILRELERLASDGGVDAFAFIYSIASLDFRNTCLVPVNFYAKFWVVCILCPAMMLFIYAVAYFVEKNLPGGKIFFYAPRWLRLRMNHFGKTVRYGNALATMGSFLYSPILSIVLGVFVCTDVGNGESRLSADFSISCTTVEYARYKAFAMFLCGVLLFPFPLYIFALLLHLTKLPGTATLRLRLGIFVDCYHYRFSFWEVLMQMRKLAIWSMVLVPSSTFRIYVVSIMLGCLLMLHAAILPFRRVVDNFTETVSLAVLTGCALYISTEASDLRVQTILIVAYIPLGAILIGGMFSLIFPKGGLSSNLGLHLVGQRVSNQSHSTIPSSPRIGSELDMDHLSSSQEPSDFSYSGETPWSVKPLDDLDVVSPPSPESPEQVTSFSAPQPSFSAPR